MKSILVVLFLALSGSVAMAEDWTTTDGMSYQNVRVIRVEDDAITIIYKDGGALIPLFKLPPPIQKKFDYDPVRAKIAAEHRAQEDTINAQALAIEMKKAEDMKRAQQIKDAAALSGSTNTVRR